MTRPTKWRTRAAILLGAMGPLLVDRGAHVNGQTSVEPRWAQSSFLLSPNSSSPTFIIISGKTYVAGQTDSSTPSISTSLSLSLSSPILDLTSPPWETLTSSPITSYSCSIPLSSNMGLIFGGDAEGDNGEPIQTLNDSSYLVSFSGGNSPIFTQETLGWENEPTRRQNSVSISATNGTITRSWIYGGLKADGSGIAFDELWEFRNHFDLSGSGDVILDEGDGWGMYEGTDGPPALYDGVAVLVPSSTSSSSPPSIYIFGGVQVISNTPSLASLNQIWVFTPSSSLATGSWKTITTTNAPIGRRGFVGVGIGEGKFWIQGGRNLEGDVVYGESYVLDVEEGSWTEMSSQGVERWGHSAVIVGETVVMAFGYGADQPAATTLEIYAPGNDSYLTSYYPSFVIDDSSSSSSSSSSATASSGGSDGTLTAGTGTVTTSTPTTNPTSDPTAASSNGALGTSVFGSSNTAGDAAISTAGWSVPGGVASSGAATSTPTSGSSSNASGSGSSSSSSSSGSSSKPAQQKLVGGVVGGILGSLMLGIGAVLLIRRSRAQSSQYGHYQDESWHFINGGNTGGGGVVGSYPSYGGGAVEKALPVKMRGTNSARNTFSSLWKGAVGGVEGRGRRFDMLHDEDAFSEKYDIEGDAGRYGWTHFDDGGAEEREAGPSSGSSYFALGAIPRREQPYSSLFDVDVASNVALAPIAEWEEQADPDTTSASSIRELQSAESHTSTVPSAKTSSNQSSNPPLTPSSFPSTKSTGSNPLATTVGSSPSPNRRASLLAANMDTPSKMSRSSSTNSENRKSLWWGRLSKSASSHDNPHERIRDPAPPPILDAITEVSNSRRGWSGTDEQGQLSAREEGHHHSHSSGVSMRTATSSQLEERMRGMDVIQRMRTESEQSFAGTFGQREEELGDFGEMPLTEEPEQDIATPQTGAVIWKGDNTFDATPTPPQDPFFDSLPLPLLPPVAARSPPPSPRKLHGPRPAPLPAIITQNLPSSSSSPALSDLSERPATAGAVGVRAMVEKFELRKATLINSPTSSPVAVSPSLPNLQSLSTPGTDRRSSKVVDHGLAKKPVLFVANPDS